MFPASNSASRFNPGSGSSGLGSAYSGRSASPGGASGNPYCNPTGSGSNGTGSTGTGSTGTGSTGTGSTGTGSTGSGSTGSGTNGSSGQSPTSSLGSQIVAYAQNNLGQMVGDGSSKALVDAALSNAGAKPASQNVFGDVVAAQV